jgi:hypothetical protein
MSRQGGDHEYAELARFLTGDEPGFVNAVLDCLAHRSAPPSSGKPRPMTSSS